jgi:hypothetical protein
MAARKSGTPTLKEGDEWPSDFEDAQFRSQNDFFYRGSPRTELFTLIENIISGEKSLQKLRGEGDSRGL